MHFEFLVEGHCELVVLSTLMPTILGEYGSRNTWKIHKHRGVGELPEQVDAKANKADQSLLHNLPSKLRAYGKSDVKDFCVVILVDLDDRGSVQEFRNEIKSVVDHCTPSPVTLICIAVEELEAWYFGDQQALLDAYPDAKRDVLNEYVQDSICGTWERFAEAVHEGGLTALLELGKRSRKVLEVKKRWAVELSKRMSPARNISPSFILFYEELVGVRSPD